MILHRRKYRMGDLVQRFGDFTKGEPSLVLDNPRWHKFGNPDEVKVSFRPSTGKRASKTILSIENPKLSLYKQIAESERIAKVFGLVEVARLLNEARYLIAEEDD